MRGKKPHGMPVDGRMPAGCRHYKKSIVSRDRRLQSIINQKWKKIKCIYMYMYFAVAHCCTFWCCILKRLIFQSFFLRNISGQSRSLTWKNFRNVSYYRVCDNGFLYVYIFFHILLLLCSYIYLGAWKYLFFQVARKYSYTVLYKILHSQPQFHP